MKRMGLVSLVVAVVLLGVGVIYAQDNTYPLTFQYDNSSDDYYAVAEIAASAGDTLQVTMQGGSDVYYFVYTDEEDLYEGESLAGFVVPNTETITLEVSSVEDANGQVTVIHSGGNAAPAQPAANTGNQGMNNASGSFAEAACPFDVPPEVDVTCGTLTVPENRQASSGTTIDLMVAIIPARAANPLPDPIFYLEGGPGGSAIAGIDSWYNSPYRDQRDIILLDQRGTGFSEPSLNCPEMDDSEDISAVEACRDRLLADGVDLTAYNSRENAADVDALRQALGYDQVNLYSISYGTRLALTVMRDYPAGLRSVVLDSVYPPNVDSDYSVTADTYALINSMFENCAAQPTCAQAFPNLEQRFYDALDQLDANPPTVTDPESGEQYDLFAVDVVGNLETQLQRTDLVTAIPASLDALASGDYDGYLDLAQNGSGTGSGDAVGLAQELAAELYPEEVTQINQLAAQGDSGGIIAVLNDALDLSPQEAQQAAQGFIELASGGGMESPVSQVDPPDVDDDSEGMNMSVQCNEELSFMTLDQAEADANASGAPEVVIDAVFGVARNEFEQCTVWPSGTAAPVENQAVVSSVPTLVLAAQYDTATPSYWSDLAAQSLSNSFLFHFPMVGHGVIDGGNCPVSIGLAFLSNPFAAPDGSCIASMNTQFYVP